ncbi:hypothetical protein HYH03_014918 [Edaphochlamys debaryana]|uniref:Uncharacterized protein n=1 Tax=Edaphochlamys debaryana TaxID=47281 RepID=A0A835XQL4_9CHLO|nr:hypothetical protein HYH03_014918 [Edaphochlamys debaryana]|eukprot:KAG2486471.1 hypothetical protein HYH03_014918 [Edaphochlamys debaryana]
MLQCPRRQRSHPYGVEGLARGLSAGAELPAKLYQSLCSTPRKLEELLCSSGVFVTAPAGSGMVRIAVKGLLGLTPSFVREQLMRKGDRRADSFRDALGEQGAGGVPPGPALAALSPQQRLVVAEVARVLLTSFARADRRHPEGGLYGRRLGLLGEEYCTATGQKSPGGLGRLLQRSGLFRVMGGLGSNPVITFKPAAGGAAQDPYRLSPEEAHRRILAGQDPTAAPAPAPAPGAKGQGRGRGGLQAADRTGSSDAPGSPLSTSDLPEAPAAEQQPSPAAPAPAPQPLLGASSRDDGPTYWLRPRPGLHPGAAPGPCPAPGPLVHMLQPEPLPLGRPLRLAVGADARGRAATAAEGAGLQEAPHGGGGGAGPAADADGVDPFLKPFLRLLPRELRREVRRSARAAASASGPSSRPPLLVDLALDAGREVRLAFSDGSKRTLAGVKVPMREALVALVARVRAMAAEEGGAGAEGAEEEPEWALPRGARADRARSSRARVGRKRGRDSDGEDEPHRSLPYRGAPPPAKRRGCFGSDNRCCPPGTLHRVSAIREPYSGAVVGLTYRLARHLPGVAGALADVLADLAGRGRAWGRQGQGQGGEVDGPSAGGGAGAPGGGAASKKLGGRRLAPARCIGSARRLMVGPRHRLAEVMVEAVQNHGPEVVIVDEIANAQEVAAARTIAARGVVLVASAHGTGLRSLMANSDLNPLVGGLQTVTLGDALARQTNHGAKTRTERRNQPVFRSMVEVLGGGRLLFRPDVAASVDAVLGVSPRDTAWQQQLQQGGEQAGAGAGGGQQGPPHAQQRGRGAGPRRRGPPLAQALEAAPPPPPPCVQQHPGSLLLLRGGGAGQGQGAAGVERLPPLEQLRWTEAGAGGGGSWPGAGGRLMVQLLRPGEEVPEAE